ncbi:hypothetical protein [Microcoleus sp. FACHB-831]|uniref:hypothetical protein n=1 Tax=Microcoleus sp. FACHB-831 TaxID=2692827 RepID=UPI0016852148|nr:hypothetical protein [Microcoleus sp. FACHB-831]
MAFVRGFDRVCECQLGGATGIGTLRRNASGGINFNPIGGDLKLLKLSKTSTSAKYYSGWVDDAQINPYPTVVPQERPKNPQPNPLKSAAATIAGK